MEIFFIILHIPVTGNKPFPLHVLFCFFSLVPIGGGDGPSLHQKVPQLSGSHGLPVIVQETGFVTGNHPAGTARFDRPECIGKKDMADLCGAGPFQDLHFELFLETMIDIR